MPDSPYLLWFPTEIVARVGKRSKHHLFDFNFRRGKSRVRGGFPDFTGVPVSRDSLPSKLVHQTLNVNKACLALGADRPPRGPVRENSRSSLVALEERKT